MTRTKTTDWQERLAAQDRRRAEYRARDWCEASGRSELGSVGEGMRAEQGLYRCVCGKEVKRRVSWTGSNGWPTITTPRHTRPKQKG